MRNVVVASDLGPKLVCFLQRIFNELEGSPSISLGVSGGSMPDLLAEVFPQLMVDWSKVRLFFCDERLVPDDDPEFTLTAYKKKVLPKMSGKLTEDNFVRINNGLAAEDCAVDYGKRLRQLNPQISADEFPCFDVLLLGLGPDGHTCSLFPGHPLLQESSVWVTPIKDSRKPPPQRVTLTIPVLNNAKHVAFITTGQSKSQVVREILEDASSKLPGALVNPKSGSLTWFLDQAAAQELTQEKRTKEL